MTEYITPVRTFFEDYAKDAKQYEKNLNGFNGTLQFDFRQSGDGVVVIRIVNGSIQPVEFDYITDATTTIKASYKDFFYVKTGKMKPWKLFLFRKVKISGDKTLTRKLAAAGIK